MHSTAELLNGINIHHASIQISTLSTGGLTNRIEA